VYISRNVLGVVCDASGGVGVAKGVGIGDCSREWSEDLEGRESSIG
jgi:hypothetical protein